MLPRASPVRGARRWRATRCFRGGGFSWGPRGNGEGVGAAGRDRKRPVAAGTRPPWAERRGFSDASCAHGCLLDCMDFLTRPPAPARFRHLCSRLAGQPRPAFAVDTTAPPVRFVLPLPPIRSRTQGDARSPSQGISTAWQRVFLFFARSSVRTRPRQLTSPAPDGLPLWRSTPGPLPYCAPYGPPDSTSYLCSLFCLLRCASDALGIAAGRARGAACHAVCACRRAGAPFRFASLPSGTTCEPPLWTFSRPFDRVFLSPSVPTLAASVRILSACLHFLPLLAWLPPAALLPPFSSPASLLSLSNGRLTSG